MSPFRCSEGLQIGYSISCQMSNTSSSSCMLQYSLMGLFPSPPRQKCFLTCKKNIFDLTKPINRLSKTLGYTSGIVTHFHLVCIGWGDEWPIKPVNTTRYCAQICLKYVYDKLEVIDHALPMYYHTPMTLNFNREFLLFCWDWKNHMYLHHQSHVFHDNWLCSHLLSI